MRIVMRKGLEYSHLERKNFVAAIDAAGGWPLWATHVLFKHGDEPFDCAFSDGPLRDEWWTTIMSADDYYWAKVSAEKKAEVRAEYRREMAQEIRFIA